MPKVVFTICKYTQHFFAFFLLFFFLSKFSWKCRLYVLAATAIRLAYVARRRATLSVGLLYFWFVAVHFNVCERVRFGVYIFALSCCWHDLLPILITSNAGQNMFCVFSCAIKYERRKKKIRLRTAPPQTYVGGRKWLAFIIKPCSCNYSVYYI